jgi:hypothetical protein
MKSSYLLATRLGSQGVARHSGMLRSVSERPSSQEQAQSLAWLYSADTEGGVMCGRQLEGRSKRRRRRLEPAVLYQCQPCRHGEVSHHTMRLRSMTGKIEHATTALSMVIRPPLRGLACFPVALPLSHTPFQTVPSSQRCYLGAATMWLVEVIAVSGGSKILATTQKQSKRMPNRRRPSADAWRYKILQSCLKPCVAGACLRELCELYQDCQESDVSTYEHSHACQRDTEMTSRSMFAGEVGRES